MKKTGNQCISRREACLGGVTAGLGLSLASSNAYAEQTEESLPCVTAQTIDDLEKLNDQFLELIQEFSGLPGPKNMSEFHSQISKVAEQYLQRLKKAKNRRLIGRLVRREQQAMIEVTGKSIPDLIPDQIAPPADIAKAIEKAKSICAEKPTTAQFILKIVLEVLGANLEYKDIINILNGMPDVVEAISEASDAIHKREYRRLSGAASKLVDAIFSKNFLRAIGKHAGEGVMTSLSSRFAAKLVPFIGYAFIINDIISAIVSAYEYQTDSPKCTGT